VLSVGTASALLMATALQAASTDATAPPPAGLAAERALRGTTAWEPLEPNAPPHAIEGYASQTSVAPGERLLLRVSTRPAARYQVQIFRLGWCGGLGGRLIACLPACTKSAAGRPRPLTTPEPVTGRVRVNWPVTQKIRIPASWASGYYVAKLVLDQRGRWPNLGRSAVVPFIVRRATGARPSTILVVSATATEQAYNNWGGKSLYPAGSTGGVKATHVSFDRPYNGQLYFFETDLMRFLEESKLDVSYVSDLDVHARPEQLLRHKLVLVNGHDEYWSSRMFDAYERARDRGVNLAFFGGNIGDWQVRFEDGNRTMVGYKSAAADPHPDPRLQTDRFATLEPPRPQCRVIGTQFSDQVGELINRFRINPAAASDPWFAGTGFKAGQIFTSRSFELDVQAPAGCITGRVTTFFTAANDPRQAPAVRYVAPSGAIVFGAGSYALSKGLDNPRLRRFVLNAITSMSK
jgi:hypothetical protein